VELTCRELSSDIFRGKKLKLSNCRETHLGWSHSRSSLGMRPLLQTQPSAACLSGGRSSSPPCIPQRGPAGTTAEGMCTSASTPALLCGQRPSPGPQPEGATGGEGGGLETEEGVKICTGLCRTLGCSALRTPAGSVAPSQRWLEKSSSAPQTQLFHSSTSPWFAHRSSVTQICKPDAAEPQPKAAHLGPAPAF